MDSPEFNFRKHQTLKGGGGRGIRFVFYLLVIGFLIFYLFRKQQISKPTSQHNEISNFSIQTDTDSINPKP